ncbi:MAG: hypothetical protein R3E58_09090 [Phycisphaerae bacterium]|nr:hypothetical protein [Phycisphaerales bacterium]
MMKFFRKYNRHLLAVFMAGLLVIWLGGSALNDVFAPDQSGNVLATSKYGKITVADTTLVDNQTRLLDGLAVAFTRKGQQPPPLSWRTRFGQLQAAAEDRLDVIDWILLKREAKAMGINVTPNRAKMGLVMALGCAPKDLERVAARQNVVVDNFYKGYADVMAVQEMLNLFQNASMPTEMKLRHTARNALEQASIELIKLPAVSFVDTGQTFTDDELAAQFDKYRAEHASSGGTDFGYYIEPSIDLQYIRIDAGKIMEMTGGSDDSLERQAFRFWQQNKETDPRFRLPTERLLEELKKQQSATSNGLTPPKFSMYYENFADVRQAAIDAVKLQKAEAEANRISSELARKLADPWFDISVKPTEYKPAPDEVKKLSYYDEVIDSVSATKRYADAIEVGLIKNIDRSTLAKTDGVGTAFLENVDGTTVPADFLAFNVEGLATIPDDQRIERSRYISKWQTQIKPLFGEDGAIYLFRVTEVTPGREPNSVDEVLERVEADLRLLAGMQRAKDAAESIAAKDTGGPLEDIWGGETELQEKITPDKGGYSEPPAFARFRSMNEGDRPTIGGIGTVTREFVETSFALASDPNNSKAVALELPAQAAWAVIKGKSFMPVFEETFASQKNQIRTQVGTSYARELILANWLSKSKIHERTGYKRPTDA